MARRKGSANKEPPKVPHTVELTTEQKLDFLANLIVDRILEDQSEGRKLLKKVEGKYAAGISTPA